jgi:hypothetical protein
MDVAQMLPGEDRGKMQFMSRRKVAAADTEHLPFELSEPWRAGFKSAARRAMVLPRLNEGAV